MNSNPFSKLAQSVINYFPSLVAGLVLILLGILAGWLIKRIIYQLCILLRLDRLLQSFRWGGEFSKADIRHALFNAIGNVAFILVFLVFLNAAFAAMQLIVLSNLIAKSVNIFPRLLVSLFIYVIGWFIARWAALTVRRALGKEGVPRSTLIARFSNAVILLFFSAMALVELDVAREIVIIGFSVIIITLAVLTIIIVLMGGKELVNTTLVSLDEKKTEVEQDR
jgi:hypothetical protein